MSPPGLPQLPGVTRPTPVLDNLGLRKMSARLFVTIVTKKDTMQSSVLRQQSQKTSTGLSDFRVGD